MILKQSQLLRKQSYYFLQEHFNSNRNVRVSNFISKIFAITSLIVFGYKGGLCLCGFPSQMLVLYM